jgi:hypothetical protein
VPVIAVARALKDRLVPKNPAFVAMWRAIRPRPVRSGSANTAALVMTDVRAGREIDLSGRARFDNNWPLQRVEQAIVDGRSLI